MTNQIKTRLPRASRVFIFNFTLNQILLPMKKLFPLLAVLALAACDTDLQETPSPTAAATTADNRIGQGEVSYTSKGNRHRGGSTFTFISNSFTQANFVLEFTEIRKDSSYNFIGTLVTPRMKYGQVARLGYTAFIPATSKVMVTEYYQDVHPQPVFIGLFEVERKKINAITLSKPK